MKRYCRLKSWQACYALILDVYRLTEGFPVRERYGITSQIRRAAVSAAANIAEGAAKRGDREFRRFLDIALGSLSEVSFYITLAGDLGYLSPTETTGLEIKRDHANRLTWGLYRTTAASTRT